MSGDPGDYSELLRYVGIDPIPEAVKKYHLDPLFHAAVYRAMDLRTRLSAAEAEQLEASALRSHVAHLEERLVAAEAACEFARHRHWCDIVVNEPCDCGYAVLEAAWREASGEVSS